MSIAGLYTHDLAALSAIRKLVADGSIPKHETVVLLNTGGALKYLDVLHDRR